MIAEQNVSHWWRHTPLLHRFLTDFIYAELVWMRRGSNSLPPLPWDGTLHLEADLGLDSLERYALASALTTSLQTSGQGTEQDLLQASTLTQWGTWAAGALEQGAYALSFKTSGSSGVPQHCTHQLALLWQEVEFFATQLPQAQRIVCMVPAHHIYGFLFSVLLPLACAPAGLTVLDGRRLLPAQLIEQSRSGDIVIGFPEFWRAVAQQSPRWPAQVTGVSSTAPCPAPLALELAASGLQLIEVYGSSESAGVGWRNDANLPYRLLPYWRRADEGTMLVRTAADGVDHRCACPDRLDWRDAQQFVPLGRHDAAVQVGGVNVYPAQVAAMLKRHPGVSDAQVRLMRADEGQRLKAFIVVGDAGSATGLAQQLAAWVRQRLPVPARPVSFTFGTALPTNRQGKLTDWIIDSDQDQNHIQNSHSIGDEGPEDI